MIEEQIEFSVTVCPMCQGDGAELGSLGKLKWYRCVDCGWEFTQEEK
jgi:rubredoxin